MSEGRWERKWQQSDGKGEGNYEMKGKKQLKTGEKVRGKLKEGKKTSSR